MSDPNDKDSKLLLKLTPCTRCGNPFMINKGDDPSEFICDNCIKLKKRKRELQIGVLNHVIESENKMGASVNEMMNQLTITRGTFNKEFFLENIKRRAQALNKSIELIEKIEETNDDNYIDEYKDLFQKMKKDLDK